MKKARDMRGGDKRLMVEEVKWSYDEDGCHCELSNGSQIPQACSEAWCQECCEEKEKEITSTRAPVGTDDIATKKRKLREDECGVGMYWCTKDKKCKPEHKRKRKKEQTTAGAAGAYSQPLFGKPIRRKIAESKKIRIKESAFIALLEKSVYSAIHGGVIKEALTDSDEKRIGVIARKELKDYEAKLEKKVDQMINKAFKGKDFETNTLKITRNAIIQLYKALWIRRSFWTEYIKNTPS